LALLYQLLRHTFVPRIRYLGFTTRGKKGPLTTAGDLYACESRTNFDTIINRQQKATLEARVSELERDPGTATADLATVGCQFSQVSNQLQEVSEEATRLCENNAKLSEDLEGESCGCFPLSSPLLFVSCRVLTRRSSLQGVRVSRRDDHEVGGNKAEAEHRPPQGHQEGWCNRTLVGAASE
jgi:hypothetical protein